MSEMLQKEKDKFVSSITPEELAARKEKFDAYRNRKYNGKPWRRMTNQEIADLGDAALSERLRELDPVNFPSKPKTKKSVNVGGKEIEISDDIREVQPDEEFVLGEGGDLPCNTDEDWASLDKAIAKERKRIFKIRSTPPRTDRYLEVFKEKYPDRTEKEVKEGFVLTETEHANLRDRQEKRHKRAGRLTNAEVERREAIAPENKTALAYASLEETTRIQNEIFQNSGVDGKHMQKLMAKSRRDAYIKKMKFEVMEDDEFSPEEDLLDPDAYWHSEPVRRYVEMPVDQLINEQRESLATTELVRHIPPKEEKPNE